MRAPIRALSLGLWALLLSTLGAASSASAQGVPARHIPPTVLLELRVVENQFKQALATDCAQTRCHVQGCVYVDHLTLDQPRTASLPGLPAEEGPGSVEPQHFLTQARCEFSHEKSVRAGDVRKLERRLEKRLSHGWLNVEVKPEALEPIPQRLAEPEEDEPDEEEEPPKDEEEAAPPLPEELTGDLALRQLWNELLPHSPWMIALALLTFTALTLIWAARRLGAPSMEDRMLEAQLAQGALAGPAARTEAVLEPEVSSGKPEVDDDEADEQEQLWTRRLEQLEEGDDDMISRLLREWLRAGDYATLARALLIFGDRVTRAFEGRPELALKKVEFARYFRDVDEASLPSRGQFFRHLNQEAMASLLLSQDDVQLYRSLQEDFGPSGFVSLMSELPPRYASLLFALCSFDQQQEVAPVLRYDLRKAVAEELLSSTRISMNESSYLADCLDTVRDGEPLPDVPDTAPVREHGPPVDGARALSALLPHLSAVDREALFTAALERHGGALPHWYEDIAFNHMLSKLPAEDRNDLLLEMDIRALSAWLQSQPAEWRQPFVAELSGPLQDALAQNAVVSSRGELETWTRRGQEQLVEALKGIYARRGVRFVDLVV